MSTNLKWLHISDIHFHPKTEWRDSAARASLIKYLKEVFEKDESLRPDLIFCTGDIAFGETGIASLAKQYEQAAVFFDYLLRTCGREGNPLPKERLFVVPGNHDINRNSINTFAQETWARKAEESHHHADKISQMFHERSAEFKDAVRRLDDYSQFIQTHLPHQHDAEGRCFYIRTVNIDGSDFAIVGFNSAWSCAGPEDDRHLWFAAKCQCNMAESLIKDAAVCIGIIHHPIDCLNQADRDIMTRRIPGNFHFWLHGHSHNAWVVPGAKHITIAAGAVGAKDSDEFGFNLVCYNLNESKGTVHLHTYSPRDNSWVIAPVANHAPKGIWPVQLLSGVNNESESSVASPISEPRSVDTYHPTRRIFNVPFRQKGDQVIGREEPLLHLNRHGFTAEDLDRLVWHDSYPLKEQQELLKFMIDTQTCFEFTKGVYIAPQLLSKGRPSQINRRNEWREPQGPAIKFRYPFLHMAIIERFIVQAGRMVREEDPIIWRNGIAIYDATCNIDALVESDLANREIRVLTHGDQPLILIRKIIGELRRLHDEYKPELLFSADGGKHFCSERKTRRIPFRRGEKSCRGNG